MDERVSHEQARKYAGTIFEVYDENAYSRLMDYIDQQSQAPTGDVGALDAIDAFIAIADRKTDACDAAKKAVADLRTHISRIERFNESLERLRPLCPDHRDKAQGECLLCRLEKAEGERDDLVAALDMARRAINELVLPKPTETVLPEHAGEVKVAYAVVQEADAVLKRIKGGPDAA